MEIKIKPQTFTCYESREQVSFEQFLISHQEVIEELVKEIGETFHETTSFWEKLNG